MSNFQVNLSGKNAIVTGAGDGVGKAIALALASAGANIFAVDLNVDRAEAVAKTIRDTYEGLNAIGHRADISNKFQVGPLIEIMRVSC